MDDLSERFKEHVQKRSLFSLQDLLIITISGGVDSVVLTELCKLAGLRFVLAHVNFQLREQESERDELFVRNLAASSGASVYVKQINTVQYASANSISIQVAARQLRYEWFETLRLQLQKEKSSKGEPGHIWILTAHHMDDSVETMLMNIFRGTGIEGLRGIREKQGSLIRPLLPFTKDEILAYAGKQQLQWVEDSSNQLDKYTRNYFRNQLIPMLRKIYPQVDQNLYANLQRFKDASILYKESVDKHIKKLLQFSGAEVHIPIRKISKLPAPDTILYEIVQAYGFTAHQAPAVTKLLSSETGSHLKSSSHRIIKNRNWLIIAPVEQGDSELLLIEESESEINFQQGKIGLSMVPCENISFSQDGKPLQHSGSIALLDAKKIRFPLILRKWKEGDYFYPLGMKKKKKIARFLIDTKRSKTDKERIWVLESDKKILWVVGKRIDERFKISPSTKNVLTVTLHSS
jgi:tRNA(Ile)-lysidine synthase